MFNKIFILVLFILAGNLAAQSVDFVQPKDKESVMTTFKVIFSLEGMEIRPEGDLTSGTGHHHLLINTDYIPEKITIPNDENHIHFGKGQIETEIHLKPGRYKLTLQFGDGLHRSYGKKMSKSINIVVIDAILR
tara:strand:+ start:810 stop:1211 length:402 start_codon:yes stop_codon:yes gene_type:complete